MLLYNHSVRQVFKNCFPLTTCVFLEFIIVTMTHSKENNSMFKSRLRHRRTIYLLVVTFILANPCCSNPCQNQGVCMSVGFDHYKCDCTRTGFYGENCSTRKFALGCPRLEGGCIQFSLHRFESQDAPHSFHPPFFSSYGS